MLFGCLGSVTLLGDAKGVSFYMNSLYSVISIEPMLRIYMNLFIGTKQVKATPMTRIEYNNYRGWELPKDEEHLREEAGFLVEYVDGGRANDARHTGYISWSPADVFTGSYRENGKLTFGDALAALKDGFKVCRTGWNGKNQYVVAQTQKTSTSADKIWNKHNKAYAEELGGYIDVAPYCTLKTAQDTLAMGWTPSTGDMFAEDWLVIE